MAAESLLRLKYNLDLALAALFSLLLIPAVVLTDSLAARITLGVPFLLFIPGYALVAAFFPGRTRLSGAERLAYSVALTIAVVMLDGLLLNYVWTIDVYPLLISLEGMTLPSLAVAWVRRRDLMADERIAFFRNEEQPMTAGVDILLITLLVLAIIGAGGVAVYADIKNIQPYSEFYLLGAEGKAADYPQKLAVKENGQLTLVLTNHEKQSVAYTVKIAQEDGRTLIAGNEQTEVRVTLANGQKQSYAVTFSFDAAGDSKTLEFDLYKDGSTQVYLRTYLRVDVR